MKIRLDAKLMRHIKLTTYVLVFTLLVPVYTAIAGHTRASLPLPAHQIFERMLEYYNRSDYASMKKSLMILAPLLADLDKEFATVLGQDIQQAVSSENSGGDLEGLLLNLVFWDMKSLLLESSRAHKEIASIHISRRYAKKAYLNYMILSKYKIAPADFGLDRDNKVMFKQLVMLPVTKQQSFEENVTKILDSVDSFMR